MAVRLFEAKERLDRATLQLVRATVQKRMTSVLSFAHYVARQLHRSGIHGSIYTSLDPLPDGFRAVIEYHIVSVDEDVMQKARGELYRSAYDYVGPTRLFRKVERLASEGKLEEEEEGEEIEVREIVGGDQAAGASTGGGGSASEGGEAEGNA